MIPLPPDISPNDIDQWLNGGWCLVKKRGRLVPATMRRNYDDGFLQFQDVQGDYIEAKLSEVFAHWPRCGAINVDDIALYVVREQRRQYRRTYNARQLSIDIPQKWAVMKMTSAHAANSLSPNTTNIVENVFNPHYVSADKAIRQIEQGTAFSRAINPRVIITGPYQKMMVYYNGELQAAIVDRQLRPVSDDPLVRTRLDKVIPGGALYD